MHRPAGASHSPNRTREVLHNHVLRPVHTDAVARWDLSLPLARDLQTGPASARVTCPHCPKRPGSCAHQAKVVRLVDVFVYLGPILLGNRGLVGVRVRPEGIVSIIRERVRRMHRAVATRSKNGGYRAGLQRSKASRK